MIRRHIGWLLPHFAPGKVNLLIHGICRTRVGVKLFEQFLPYVTIDCGTADCPPEWVQWLGTVVETQSLSLSAAPVPSEAVSWGEVKTLFR